jgi:hypothetical protein
MDVKQKQQAVIEFLLLEWCEGNDIIVRLQNTHDRDAYCQASVFRWTNKIRRGNEELPNEGGPGNPIVTKRILLFAQFCEMIRMPHCEPERTRYQSLRRRFALICLGLAIS